MTVTQCSRPPELSEEQLYTVIDGIGDAETAEHLAHCPYCSNRLAVLRNFDMTLESRLTRFECPSALDLTLYRLGELDARASERIAQHLQDCPLCQEELAALDFFVSDLPNDLQPEAPNDQVIHVPQHLWRASRADTSGNLALKGLQGAGDENSYDLKAGSASLFLEVQARSNGLLLTGQVVDEQVDWRGSIAELHQTGSGGRVAILDDSCEFSFEAVETAPLDLYITAATGVVLAVEQLMLSP